LSLQRDENIMVTGCKGFNSVGCGVVVWDVRNAQTPLQELKAHSQDVVSCLFSPNSHDLLLTASKDGSVVAWDVKTMDKEGSLQINRKPLSSLCHVSSRESLFAASAMDGSLSLFRFDCGGGEGREFEVVFQTDGVEEGLQSSAH
jgi:WD40 repeat protein